MIVGFVDIDNYAEWNEIWIVPSDPAYLAMEMSD